MLNEIKENLEKLVNSTEEMNKLLETMIDEIGKETIISKSRTDKIKERYEYGSMYASYTALDCYDKY